MQHVIIVAAHSFSGGGYSENLEVVALGQLPWQQSHLDISRQEHLVLEAFLLAGETEHAGVLNHRRALHGERLQHLPVESGHGGGVGPDVKIEQAQQLRRRSHKGFAQRFRHGQLLQRDRHNAPRSGADDASLERCATRGIFFENHHFLSGCRHTLHHGAGIIAKARLQVAASLAACQAQLQVTSLFFQEQ